MALLFLFNVTKKEGESSLPCPDIYLVTSRKVGVIQVLPLVSVRVLQRSRTSKMEMNTHENMWEVVGGGERRRQRERHTDRHFKNMCDCAGWQVQNLRGQLVVGNSWAGVNAAVLRQNFFFLTETTSIMLLRPFS